CRLEGGTVVDCTFTNNFCFISNGKSFRGGAVTLEVGDALLDRCTVVSNRIATSSASANSPVKDDTYAYGGGVYLKVGTVRNSLVVGNESYSYGGGIYVTEKGRVLNCTVVGNKARLAGGGIWQGGGTVTNCLCLGNVAHGVVDVADDPGFVDAANGDYRLNPASAAVDAADGDGADLGDFDRAGRPRVSGSAVDKGCYEWEASQTDFGISFRKLTPFAPGEVEFSAKAANGELRDCLWTFNGLEQMTGATVTNSFLVGSVSVSFRANLDGRSVAVDKPDWFVAYGETVHVVVENENPVFPYATWETAATNLNDAFAAVQRNGTILMGEGTYLLTDERTIDFPMTLRGANGPERTVLDANKKLRPFRLQHPSAVLDGLTLRNGRGGASSLGGGVAIRDGGQVTNCVFDACIGDVVAAAGVGVLGRGARILDCRFEGCWVDDDWPDRMRKGVAILTSGPDTSEEDLLIDRCLVRGSHEGCSRGRPWVACGDGAIWIDGGTVRNTIVTGSVLKGCGGIIATGTAKVENCTIVGNVSTNTTGTVAGLRIDTPWGNAKFDVKVYNTIIWDNLWTNGSNSAVKNVGGASGYASRLKNCWTEGDPKLRGYGKFAFRPTAGSPCIDAGSPLSWMDDAAVDVYGCPRQQGKGPDIGAAEAFPVGLKILVR
ncbi:MAG: choice-of-anchor Q domain-containing protein, partial [Kiritimatiellia bacterium]